MPAAGDNPGATGEVYQTLLNTATFEPDGALPMSPHNKVTIIFEGIGATANFNEEQRFSNESAESEHLADEHGQRRASSLLRILKTSGLWSVIIYIFLSFVFFLGAAVFLVGGRGITTTSAHIVFLAFKNLVSIMVPLVMVTIIWAGHYGFGWCCSIPCAVSAFILTRFLLLKASADPAMRPWSDGIDIPQSYQGCSARVASKQADLFTEDIYKLQFSRLMETISNHYRKASYSLEFLPFNATAFECVSRDETLCKSGFEANADLYGLGIRTGVYLQWMSGLLANNLLSSTRKEIQRLYLAFSLAVCLATAVASFQGECNFAIEIEILYWMYWGGWLVVFGTAPCSIQMSGRSQWTKLRWTTIIFYLTHMAMTYHAIWYTWYAYDRIFARMPCGTYHFFMLRMLDPSYEYWLLRDLFMFFGRPIAILLVCLFPAAGVSLVSALKHTVQGFALYRWLFPKQFSPDTGSEEGDQGQHALTMTFLEQEAHQIQSKALFYHSSTLRYQVHRVYEVTFGTISDILVPKWDGPYHGIRLITPLDIRNRRLYRITWAALGFAAYCVSVFAIEMLLKWNKVVGVYSITSTGQYFALMIGAGSFISVIWSLSQQETERRRKQRIHLGTEFDEDVELQTFSQSLSEAVSHAFSQPDAEFLSNGGAFAAGECPGDGEIGAPGQSME